MQNPLDRHPRIRQFAFDIQWVANLVMAVLAFVLTSMDYSPLWFLIVAGSLNIVWSYLGLTARGNVKGTDAVGMPLTNHGGTLMANPYDPIVDDHDPLDDDQPPYFPVADPDAPMRPDWDGVEPEGEQMPDAEAGDDE